MAENSIKKKILYVLTILTIGIGCFLAGFGYGQSSAYKKQKDDFSLDQLHSFEGNTGTVLLFQKDPQNYIFHSLSP